MEHIASRKLRQGMGRALRNSTDRAEFYFLDKRISLPNSLRKVGKKALPKNTLSEELFEGMYKSDSKRKYPNLQNGMVSVVW